VQADDRILVAGRSNPLGDDLDVAVARYLTDGSLDTTFGPGGWVTTDVDLRYDEAYEVALERGGKIVAVGASAVDIQAIQASASDVLVVRYLGLVSAVVEIESLQDLVFEMAEEGMIQRRRARSLISKLDLAIYFLERNGEPVALQFLRLFRVETILATTFGEIQPAAGAELVERIDVLIAALRSR
jgi:hypothetical protein